MIAAATVWVYLNHLSSVFNFKQIEHQVGTMVVNPREPNTLSLRERGHIFMQPRNALSRSMNPVVDEFAPRE